MAVITFAVLKQVSIKLNANTGMEVYSSFVAVLLCCTGLSRSVAVCLHKDDQHVVKPMYCAKLDKPDDRIKYCNVQPCPPR